jgi:ATP-dependent DNA helicase RecG
MSGVSFIQELINHQKDLPIAFFGTYNSESVLAAICAFLNTDGGWILIGHDGDDVIGVAAIRDKSNDLQELIYKNIFPQPLVDVRTESFKGQDVILINVLKGSRRPYSYKHIYYVQTAGNIGQASEDEISMLLRSANDHVSTWEKQTALDANIEDLDSDQITYTIIEAKRFSRGKSLPSRGGEFLNYFQLIDFNLIKNGAVILFGKNPIHYLPQTRIRITVLPYGKTGSQFSDSLLIENNLFEAYDRLQLYFKQQLPQVSKFSDVNWERFTYEKYPLEALDEAVLNAMVHRDYADVSGEIIINIYSNKMEIINSGEMPADIVVMKSQINDHHSILRNPTVAHMFFLRGKMEKLGRGLTLIRDRFAENGLRLPEWSSLNGYTMLTLFSEPLKVSLNERAFQFLQKIKIGGEFNREVYQQAFEGNISERTARIDIGKMKEGGWVRQIGDGQQTKYVRTNKELPEIAG